MQEEKKRSSSSSSSSFSTSHSIKPKDQAVDLEAGGEQLVSGEKGGSADSIMEEVPPSSKIPLTHKIMFMIMGTAELYVWNAVLCILEDVRSNLYPDYHSMSDTLNAVNNLTNLGVAVYCIYTGAMNQFWILTAIAVQGFACFALACVTQWAPGIHGVVWYHLVLLVAGAGCGMMQTGVFGLASALPAPCPGYVSTGLGISGVTTWVLWMIISNSSITLKAMMWALMMCGFAVLAISFVNYFILIRSAEVKTRVKQIQTSLKEEANNPDAPGYVFLFKQCWRHCFSIWWNMYTTLFVFPTIGPLGWGDPDFFVAIIGCFQIGDLVGRYAPNIHPKLIIPPIPCFWIVCARTVMIIFGLVGYFHHTNAFWGHRATMMIIMVVHSVSNGYLCTCIYVNTPRVVQAKDWVSRVTSMVTVFLLLGIACGLWTARIFTAIAN